MEIFYIFWFNGSRIKGDTAYFCVDEKCFQFFMSNKLQTNIYQSYSQNRQQECDFEDGGYSFVRHARSLLFFDFLVNTDLHDVYTRPVSCVLEHF